MTTSESSRQAHPAGRPLRTRSNNTLDAAARLISETAHDIRSPLTSIRESIRLVCQGDLGDINAEQRGCLSAAINQCDCIDQLVGELAQLDRIRSGLLRVRRRWIPVSEIRQSVDETLQPWTLPREITVVWDGADDPNQVVFADPSSLRRLIVNLVANAIRVTSDGECVLIDLQAVRGGEAIRWTVIDQGTGISEAEMRQLASRQVSTSGGEGLGLMICRQLSAAHFSMLNLRSRLGTGTEVSFETPSGGPKSVAACWMRWRRAQLRSLGQSAAALRADGPERSQVMMPAPRRGRMNPPSVTVEITTDNEVPRNENEMVMGTVTLGAAMSRQAADQFDKLVQSQLRLFDLVYRVDTRRWVWVFDANQATIARRIDTINDAAQAQIDNVRLNWGRPQRLALDSRRTRAMFSDLLTRESLAASSSSRVQDANEVRLGTAPIEHSNVAARRLDAELRRLSGEMKGQTAELRRQVEKLRPVY
ncbi:MAG: HAMP domain-containing histidine kinase [Pirellulales bacterium]|nr:HAMP domain-containing histidine kinase [Pirellulales bacterium]